ncbi:LacI family transcriptional regulator [Arthrobacter sp. Leaf337]|uniref:LacI family DNA-binding transcriptional regulator n=1 Tax=Arthrobacter sp. Leaf337 TaxID=1736342 RepID=UPI0006F26E5E|nr:substrate-binding domain-containing protein [Arthrobacter sp. Leaf337]KQR73203.1 LacI family transcriptional regulator [Arthrobacter sp. Leaf337]
MQKQPTIRDVAQAAGVSVAVVSRVLNPGSGPVADATRRRVRDVIQALGYHPRTAARELKHGPPTTLGLMLADVSNPFFARLADNVVREADARGIQVLLMTTQEDEHLESECLETLIERRVSGVIATPTGDNLDIWKKLQDIGTDMVFVDRSIPSLPEVDVVGIDNVESARSATGLLAAYGHKRIGIVSGPAVSTTGRDRIAGYRLAVEAAGLEVDERLVRHAAFRGAAGGDAVTALLNLEEPPSALVVANTAQVTAVLRRLSHAGLSIPDKLSVVVFEDSPWTELMTPPLTIIRQPVDLLARHSVQLALAKTSGKSNGKPTTIRVAAELVERSSVSRL